MATEVVETPAPAGASGQASGQVGLLATPAPTGSVKDEGKVARPRSNRVLALCTLARQVADEAGWTSDTVHELLAAVDEVERRPLDPDVENLVFAARFALEDWFQAHYGNNDVGLAALIRDKLRVALVPFPAGGAGSASPGVPGGCPSSTTGAPSPAEPAAPADPSSLTEAAHAASASSAAVDEGGSQAHCTPPAAIYAGSVPLPRPRLLPDPLGRDAYCTFAEPDPDWPGADGRFTDREIER